MNQSKQRRRWGWLASATLLAALAACTPAPQRVYIVGPPPPERVESVTVAPAPDYVWIRGNWRWDGRAYAWVPGAGASRAALSRLDTRPLGARYRDGTEWTGAGLATCSLAVRIGSERNKAASHRCGDIFGLRLHESAASDARERSGVHAEEFTA